MDYKKINGLLVKDYFSKNKSTKLGTAGDNYIIIPEPSFFMVVPSDKMVCDPNKFLGDIPQIGLGNILKTIEDKDSFELAEQTGITIKSDWCDAIEFKSVSGDSTTLINEKIFKLFGKNVSVMIHVENERCPVGIWNEDLSELLGGVCPIAKRK